MINSINDWIVLVVVALVLFGGSGKIPELFRSLGKAMGEFKKGQIEIEREIQRELNGEPQRSVQQRVQNSVLQQSSKEQSIEELQKRIEELQRQIEEMKGNKKGMSQNSMDEIQK